MAYHVKSGEILRYVIITKMTMIMLLEMKLTSKDEIFQTMMFLILIDIEIKEIAVLI